MHKSQNKQMKKPNIYLIEIICTNETMWNIRLVVEWGRVTVILGLVDGTQAHTRGLGAQSNGNLSIHTPLWSSSGHTVQHT